MLTNNYYNEISFSKHKERKLTSREIEYLALAAMGYKNTSIAQILYVSESTVKKTLESIFKKLNSKDRANSVMIAFMNNILNQTVLNEIEERYSKEIKKKDR